jgi:diacylglycerol O-acyltransferase
MKMSPLDFLFLAMETVENPAHVASLGIYEIPADYPGNFVRDLRDRLLAQSEVSPPFNLRVKPQGILPGWYEWEVDANLDLKFHVRHSALPKPGTMDDLLELVARLHARMMDRSRPLWECYLIEGLKGNRFGVYIKMHHSTIDGAGGMEMIENGLSMTPDCEAVMAWWNPSRKPASAKEWPGLQRLMVSLTSSVLKQALAIPQAAYAIFAPGFGLKKTEAGKPFRSGKSMFNKNISASRTIGIGSLSLAEVKATGTILGVTLNDVFLTACAGALCKYMTQKGSPPDKDFSAAVPVAMSREGGNNAIAYILVALHTDITNPLARAIAVNKSAQGAKHDQANLSRAVINTMTLMAQGTQAALGRIGLSEVLPPAAGLVISNVPGMRQTRYLMGAQMTSFYPLSVLIHAQGLNITVLSYADELQYGLLSTPEIAPDVQQLADLIGKEFRIIQAAARRLEKKKAAEPAPSAIHSKKKTFKKKALRKKVARKPKSAPIQ